MPSTRRWGHGGEESQDPPGWPTRRNSGLLRAACTLHSNLGPTLVGHPLPCTWLALPGDVGCHWSSQWSCALNVESLHTGELCLFDIETKTEANGRVCWQGMQFPPLHGSGLGWPPVRLLAWRGLTSCPILSPAPWTWFSMIRRCGLSTASCWCRPCCAGGKLTSPPGSRSAGPILATNQRLHGSRLVFRCSKSRNSGIWAICWCSAASKYTWATCCGSDLHHSKFSTTRVADWWGPCLHCRAALLGSSTCCWSSQLHPDPWPSSRRGERCACVE